MIGWARASGALLCVACLAWLGCTRENDAGQDVAPADPSALLRQDRRLIPLLQECEQTAFYDRDLSDLVPVLLEKVERADPDALRRAKEELGLLGAGAFPAMGSRFHSYYADPMRSAYLENMVDALTFNASDASHELLLEALRHPQETVRAKALDGLERLARPEDFDLLVERLAIETRELRRHTVAALFRADRERAEDLLLDAMGRGVDRELWVAAAPSLAKTEREVTARRCAELFPGLDPAIASHLAAAAARFELPGALEFLRAELRADGLQRRLHAVDALRQVGLVDELGPLLLEDEAVDVRAIVAAAFRTVELDDRRRAWLRAALNDPDAQVQGEALAALCEHADDEGLARALALLDGEPGPLQSALSALRSPLQGDPTLVRVAFDRLMQRNAREEHRPIQQRTATFKAIGQIPHREAAEFLHRVGVAAGDQKIESLRAHDWLTIQAANTGIEGRAFLAEALRDEADPERRIDLIDALGSVRDDLARTSLLEWVEFGAHSPFERLFAASTLIRVGPSWEVAPRLKRVAFGMTSREEAEARAALQCLLWRWY